MRNCASGNLAISDSMPSLSSGRASRGPGGIAMTTQTDLPVVPMCRIPSGLPEHPNQWLPFIRPASTERGASRSSRTLGAGCDGRKASKRDFRADERCLCGRRSRVVLASRAFPELFQRQISVQIHRAGLGLSSAVFCEYQESRRKSRSDVQSASQAARKKLTRSCKKDGNSFLRFFSSSPIRDLISIGSRMRSMNICAVESFRLPLNGPLGERASLWAASFRT